MNFIWPWFLPFDISFNISSTSHLNIKKRFFCSLKLYISCLLFVLFILFNGFVVFHLFNSLSRIFLLSLSLLSRNHLVIFKHLIQLFFLSLFFLYIYNYLFILLLSSLCLSLLELFVVLVLCFSFELHF